MTCVAAFYRFVALTELAELQAWVREQATERGILGTVLLAAEGINGTVAGERDAVQGFFEALSEKPSLAGIEPHLSDAEAVPFLRLKVRLKEEIVSIGLPTDPTERVGTYVRPEAWNDLIAEPDVVLVDVRNDYEIAVGSFEGAIDPATVKFRDFPAWAEAHLGDAARVAMFCTGGIRCEKASSLLLARGIPQVYHLKGGILAYLDAVEPEESRFHGDCFVFDERIGVGARNAPSDHLSLCHGCRRPLTPADRSAPGYEEGICCAWCVDGMDDKARSRREERRFQVAHAREHGRGHLGVDPREK